MIGFLKGALVGGLSFVAGLWVLSVVLPAGPDEARPADSAVTAGEDGVPRESGEVSTPAPVQEMASLPGEPAAPSEADAAPPVPSGIPAEASPDSAAPQVHMAQAGTPRPAPRPPGVTAVRVPASDVEAALAEAALLSETRQASAAPATPAQDTEGNRAAPIPPAPRATEEGEAEAPDPLRLGPPGVGNAVPRPAEVVAEEPQAVPEADPAASVADEIATLPPVPGAGSPETAGETAPAALEGGPAAEAAAAPAPEPPGDTLAEAPDAPETDTPELTAMPEAPAPSMLPTGLHPAPAGRLRPGSMVDGVRMGRLPQTGAAPAPGPAVEVAAEVADPDLPPWRRHAAQIERNELPPLALVLIDPARDLETERGILELPLPVTVALDPFDPDAPRRAQVYRAVGHEVLLNLQGVSPLATAGDLDVLFSSWAEDYPEVLGVLEPPSSDARRARTLAPVLMPVLQDLGLGVVASDLGLSPLLNAARSAGVARAGIYRALDTDDEDPEAVGRYLDRAAFEAERQGAVTVTAGADQAATREGLAAWLAAQRLGTRVQTVPVGAVLAAP